MMLSQIVNFMDIYIYRRLEICKEDLKMKHIILIFTLLMISILSAQEWSGPINISNTVEQDYDPEFCIDNDGVLHCVWSFKIEQNYRKIYYSKSENDGETWSEPYSISQNNELWMASPKITSDSQNNLYINIIL